MSKNTSSNRRKKQLSIQREIERSGKARKGITAIIAVIVAIVIILSVALYEIYLSPGGSHASGSRYNYPGSIAGFSKVASSPDIVGGKIPVLFIGSMACPYCTAANWSVYSSLESSGSWSGLGYIYSNATDIYPDTPGLTFANASYSSASIVFFSYEISNRDWQHYQSLNTTDQSLFSEYDPLGHIPFILIGGMYLHVGDFYSPSVLGNISGNTIMSWISHDTANAITDNIHNASANITSVIAELETHTAILFQTVHDLNTPSMVPEAFRSGGQ